jgi:hypothetical protein
MAISEIDKNPRLGGRAIAKAGLVIGYLLPILAILGWVLLFGLAATLPHSN